MADFRAIETASQALLKLIRDSYTPADFDNNALLFQLYLARDFGNPMSAGVSVFLYRTMVNGSHRIPAGRRAPDGRRFHPQLPLDLHYFITIWAQDASIQHRLAAWVMRLLEDTPVLPISLLDAVQEGVFQPDEMVEVIAAEVNNEDMFRIWETLVQTGYTLSLPYCLRNIRIDSTRRESDTPAVLQRQFDWAQANT